MLLSNLICIQITSPGGTPIRGKNAEMCLQLSRHSISCLPCPFSSGVSHLQLLLSALTLPALSLICTLPLLCLFWLVFSVISCRLIHCDFCTVERGLFNGKFANWQMVPGLRHGRVDVSCSSCKSLDFPHSRSLWGFSVYGVLDGLLRSNCKEVTLSQENSQILLCCCCWTWNSNQKETSSGRFEQIWLWGKEHLYLHYSCSLSSVPTLERGGRVGNHCPRPPFLSQTCWRHFAAQRFVFNRWIRSTSDCFKPSLIKRTPGLTAQCAQSLASFRSLCAPVMTFQLECCLF